MQQEQIKSGFITLIGKPNAGKSTLLNKLINTKISITSFKPQTTRNVIQGIYNDDTTQIIFLDTPGIHQHHNVLGKNMNKIAFKSIKDTDLTCLLIPVDRYFSNEYEFILKNLKEKQPKVILLLTKIDLINKQDLLKIIDYWKNLYYFETIIPISVHKDLNIVPLMTEIKKNLTIGPRFYSAKTKTNVSEEFFISEIIREKIIYATQEEIPHSVGILVTKLQKKAKIIIIEAKIFVERDSQKAIIIGNRGIMIKNIGTKSREELEKIMDKKIMLALFVEVEKDWRNKIQIIQKMGYQ